MEPTLQEAIDYIGEITHIIDIIERTFDVVCVAHICDRLTFMSQLWQDAIEMPIWFAEDIVRRIT